MIPPALPGALGAVVGELTRARGCHTVILFGSRARGDAEADSDVDLFGIAENLVVGPLFRNVDGFDFDISLADERSLRDDPEEYLKIEDGLVLVQRSSFGDDLLRRVKKLVTAGPPPLSDEERAQRLHWLQRMASRAARGDGEARYRLVWLVSELPRVRFELAGRYWLGPKRSLPLLADFDPAFSGLYGRLLAEPSADAAIACIQQLAV